MKGCSWCKHRVTTYATRKDGSLTVVIVQCLLNRRLHNPGCAVFEVGNGTYREVDVENFLRTLHVG